MNEIWVIIDESPSYEISNLGRIKEQGKLIYKYNRQNVIQLPIDSILQSFNKQDLLNKYFKKTSKGLIPLRSSIVRPRKTKNCGCGK